MHPLFENPLSLLNMAIAFAILGIPLGFLTVFLANLVDQRRSRKGPCRGQRRALQGLRRMHRLLPDERGRSAGIQQRAGPGPDRGVLTTTVLGLPTLILSRARPLPAAARGSVVTSLTDSIRR